MSLYPRESVLDHGYVQLVDVWGSDERVVEAARMSTNKGFLGWGPHVRYVRQCSSCMQIEDEPGFSGGCVEEKHSLGPANVVRTEAGDEKLLRYLWEHKHHTPFEMAGLTIEVQAPLIVFREWHRHRTQSYNEMSGRYTILPDEYYVPSVERLTAGGQDKKNRQSSVDWVKPEQARDYQAAMTGGYEIMRKLYEEFLADGMARELARLVLPVSQYSRMRASGNLRNWLAFLTLRSAPEAQWEIRQYAHEVGKVVASYFPRTWALFLEGRRA